MNRNRLWAYSLYALYILSLLATSAAAYHAGVRDGRENVKQELRQELRQELPKAFKETIVSIRQRGAK